MSDAQKRACELLLPRYGVCYDEAILDLARLFGRRAPVVLEIGFGMGETTASIAQAHPNVDFLGIEVHLPGVGALLRRIDELALANVRVIRHDAVGVVATMIAPSSLSGAHVYFPDPWPKKRHHKRRLLTAAFVRQLALRLRDDGYVHVATDWAPYADEILATLKAEPLLANTAEGFAPRPDWRPETKFEMRGRKLGHAVFDLVFRRACPVPLWRCDSHRPAQSTA